MPYETKQLGAAGHVLRYRLRYHLRIGNKSFTVLARAIKELGHPMSAARIGEAFNGYRRISTDELTALATALGVSAGALVLAKSPSSNTSLVDQIADEETDDLRARQAKLDFSISPLESELERALSLGRRERQQVGLDDPADILTRLEAKAAEAELLSAELERRLGKDWISGER